MLYWSTELSKLWDEKQSLWLVDKRTRSAAKIIKYKKANALFKKKSKEAKRTSLEKLTEYITPNTNPKKVWFDIKILSGSYSQTTVKFINSPNGRIFNSKEITNHFGSVRSDYASNSNFHASFVSNKNAFLKNSYRNRNSSKNINESDITDAEFDFTLFQC